ncbi:hypothetical protein D3C85_1788140 [compost metagenome]
MTTSKIPDTVEAWEDGTLGCDPAHMKPAPVGTGKVVDDILGIVTVPVRLPSRILAVLSAQAQSKETHVAALILDILEDYLETVTIVRSTE